MKKIYYSLLIFWGICFSITGQNKTDIKQSYTRLVVCETDIIVQNAVVDLQRYLSQVTGIIPLTQHAEKWNADPEPAIIIGNIKSLKKLIPTIKYRSGLGKEGYVLQEINYKGKDCYLLYADQSNGLVNSIYGFLNDLGFEFNLASEVIPSKLSENLSSPVIQKKPIFSVRGVLPWYNFFNSPTSWDIPDHRAFVDQLIRSGANFITFHSYEHEPFAAVEEEGEMIFGEGLRNTSVRTWGTNAMATSEYLFGTDKLFDSPYFGAETTLKGYDHSTQIAKEKAILREALFYAKNRGLTTGMGFAPLGDPTLKEDRERFIKEFTYNLEYYHFLDYIFIWQTETKGAQGHPLKYDQHILPDTRDPESKIINYGKYRSDIFKRIVEKESGINPFFKPDEEGKISRATEGARLEMFAKIALRILSRYENAPKIVIAGWGGENYLLSEEYYDGLDKVLPKEVAFSSLESLTPKTYIDKAYFELPSDRQRWPIPWLENDGDQWHPQPFLKTYEPMVKDLQRSGSQGFLSIHWRTREVEDNFGYLLNYAWDPTITKEKFMEKKAQKYTEVADELKQIYMELDSLGYRWVNGSGQNECALFTWGSGSIAHYQKLSELRDQLETMLPQVNQDKDNLIWLRDRMDWVLDYQNAEIQAELASDLLKKAEETTDEKEKTMLAKRAFGILSGDALAKAMHSYAERITTRGEYGVMATINTKAAFDWRKMYQQCCDMLALSLPLDNRWEPETRIIVPRMYGSCEAEHDFELTALILGGQTATFKYRTLGTSLWKEKPFSVKKNWVQSATIPSGELTLPGFEYMITLDNTEIVYGPKTVSIINPVAFTNQLTLKTSLNNRQINKITCKTDKKMNVIEWNEVSLADYYEVTFNGNTEVETPVTFYPYPDKLAKGTTIIVKAIRNGEVISEMTHNY